jgi:hypothetical protein
MGCITSSPVKKNANVSCYVGVVVDEHEKNQNLEKTLKDQDEKIKNLEAIQNLEKTLKEQDEKIKNLEAIQNLEKTLKEQDEKIKNLEAIQKYEKTLKEQHEEKIKNLEAIQKYEKTLKEQHEAQRINLSRNLENNLQELQKPMELIGNFKNRCELNKYKSIKRSNVYYGWNKKKNYSYVMYFFDCINNFISDNNIDININKEYNFEIDVHKSLHANNEQYSEKIHDFFNSSLMLKIYDNIYIVYRYTDKNKQDLIFHCEFDNDGYLKYMFAGDLIDASKLPYEKWYSINELPINFICEYGTYNIIRFYPKKNFIKFYSWLNDVQTIYVSND